jgi:hypothetical protein
MRLLGNGAAQEGHIRGAQGLYWLAGLAVIPACATYIALILQLNGNSAQDVIPVHLVNESSKQLHLLSDAACAMLALDLSFAADWILATESEIVGAGNWQCAKVAQTLARILRLILTCFDEAVDMAVRALPMRPPAREYLLQ